MILLLATIVFMLIKNGNNENIITTITTPKPPVEEVSNVKNIKQKALPVNKKEVVNEPVDEEYPVELEEEFISEAMESIPKLIEVDVHEPGVVFFRQKPDKQENIQMSMNELAELYKNVFGYTKKVTVVFFISGRPARALEF